MHRTLASLGCTIAGMTLAAVLTGPAPAAHAQTLAQGQKPFTDWITALKANGYTVTNGTSNTFPGCQPFTTAFGTCFGNNTATPYVITQPPLTSPNALPTYTTAMAGPGIPSPFEGSAPANPPNQQTTDDFWQIGPDQAIVTVITLPPQGAYFGFQTYALERSKNLPAYQAVPPPPGSTCTGGTLNPPYSEAPDCNYVVFGNFFNTVNNADIAAKVPSFMASPWNTYNDMTTPLPTATSFKTIAIVTTPNKMLASMMSGYFTGDATTVFTEQMPATTKAGDMHSLIKLNTCTADVTTTPCDVFTTLVRFTLAKNMQEGAAWQQGSNILIYRVELPTVDTSSSSLYDTDDVYGVFYQQGCNTNETGATPAPASCVTPMLASTSFDADLQSITSVLAEFGRQDTITPANPNGDAYSSNEASGYPVPPPKQTPTSVNGGIGSCVANGHPCAGGTQDTDYYRTFKAGSIKDMTSVFAVGVLHSDSTGDFTPTGYAPAAPVNNADYTGISIADDTAPNKNTGVADAANPNSASEYYVPPANRILLGSALTVLSNLTDTYNGKTATLLSQLPASVQKDLNNIYIHIFMRDDAAGNSGRVQCNKQVCANALANDTTMLVNRAVPSSGDPNAAPPVLPSIPDSDYVLFTERGYVLAPTAGSTPGPANFTGAAVQFLQSPYIVCDTVGTMCGQIPQ